MTKPRHHWVVRLTHWVNAVALTIMIASGLRIFNAYPAFARKGETFCCYPWEGKSIPSQLTFGGWLAGARNWHFAMMWVLVANGLLYLGFVYLHGEWRDLVPRRGFLRDSREMLRFYLFARKDHPRQGKHNALQKATYFVLPWVGVLAVVSGIAIWKPVQLAPLTDLMGGYVWARYWHFVSMVLLVLLSVVHIFMVFAVDPYSMRAILTGGYNENNSPESRNARPFYHLLPNRFRRGSEVSRSGPAPEPEAAAEAPVAPEPVTQVATEPALKPIPEPIPDLAPEAEAAPKPAPEPTVAPAPNPAPMSAPALSAEENK
ncbi:MAG: cytochrome b/b6 domain-containing protein [Gemmatimonadaceae bacterium]|nr:cytochrome b/b6 domain-containing protein [Gemmatimonadaceae bacterium]